MYHTYILKSDKDSKFYIGQTNNLEERLIRHNMGQVTATRNRKPFRLVWSEKFNTRSEAMKMEKYIKSLKGGKEFIKVLNSRS